MVLEHLKFFNTVISELLTVHVKIDEENKVLILLNSLLQSCDHIITTTLYGKETLILKEVTSTLLSNETGKRPNQESTKDRVWWSRKEKEEEKERKVLTHRMRVTFITGKVIKRMNTNIDKSC